MTVQAIPRADCHCHTFYSDGSLSPIALLDLAKEKDLAGLSITDHDTIAAYELAIPYAQRSGITLISGIEISTQYQRHSVHVLGYAFNLSYSGLHSFCQQLQKTRETRNQKILERLAKIGIPLTLSEIKSRFSQAIIGRPHIAQLMVEKGYVKSVKLAFERYLGNKSRCYVPGLEMEVEAAIELIQKAGGYAVLAHPHYLSPKGMISALCAMPFDGIEVYYGNLGLKQEQPWLTLAHKKGWLTTGGSDFHGEKKSYQSLGSSWTPAEIFELLTQRYQSHAHKAAVVPNF